MPATMKSPAEEVARTLRSIATNTDHADYASKPISSLMMVEVATDLEQKMVLLQSLEAQIKECRQNIQVLKEKGVEQIAHNGEFVFRNANGNESSILRAGYLLSSSPTRSYTDPAPPTNVNAERGEGSGKLKVWCKPVSKRIAYIVEINETDPLDDSAWRQVAYTSKSRVLIEGLTPVTKIWVRMRVLMPNDRLSSASRVQDCVVP